MVAGMSDKAFVVCALLIMAGVMLMIYLENINVISHV